MQDIKIEKRISEPMIGEDGKTLGAVAVTLNAQYPDMEGTKGKAAEIEAALADCFERVVDIIYSPGTENHTIR